MKRLHFDIHLIQVLPPSCVNRDDTNTPKGCLYGGKPHGRVSSQCWKRAIRTFFKNHAEDMPADMCGILTKKIKEEAARRLVENYGFAEEEAARAADVAARATKIASNKSGAKATIVFLSETQADAFVKAIADHKEAVLKAADNDEKEREKKKAKEAADAKKGKNGANNKKDSKAAGVKIDQDAMDAMLSALKDNPSADILLFGRMFAENASLKYDASCQVAHAISVNEVRTEYDYFTAVDDIKGAEDGQGSGYLDTKRFNDSVLYRYSTVNLSETSELVRYDKAHAAEIAKEYLRAFVLSMPTGSRNSYANNTLPSYVMVTLRDDMPVSFAPAFITTVNGDDYAAEAEQKLKDYAAWVSANYGAPVFTAELGKQPLKDILDAVEEEIRRRI